MNNTELASLRKYLLIQNDNLLDLYKFFLLAWYIVAVLLNCAGVLLIIDVYFIHKIDIFSLPVILLSGALVSKLIILYYKKKYKRAKLLKYELTESNLTESELKTIEKELNKFW